MTVVTSATQGYLVQSMYPLGYSEGVCDWNIQAEENEVIMLNFIFGYLL